MFVIVRFISDFFLIYKSVLSTTKELVTFSDLILIYQSSSQVARDHFAKLNSGRFYYIPFLHSKMLSNEC